MAFEGTILKGVGGFYYVLDGAGEIHTLRAQNKLRRLKQTPMVGDRVRFTESRGEEHGWLEAILPRTSMLSRPPVANIERVALVVAAASPEPDLLLLDRMLLCGREAGIEPVLVVGKSELDPDGAARIVDVYRGAAAQAMAVSAQTGEGLAGLRQALEASVHAFAGQSGVGKSTLINALYSLDLKTGDISKKIERGKHTTRHCELIVLPEGGMVLDTPGFSLLDISLRDPIELQDEYPEFAPYKNRCRFQPCAHNSEPDCAVRTAVDAGEIDRDRHQRYCALFDEMTQRWRDRYG